MTTSVLFVAVVTAWLVVGWVVLRARRLGPARALEPDLPSLHDAIAAEARSFDQLVATMSSLEETMSSFIAQLESESRGSDPDGTEPDTWAGQGAGGMYFGDDLRGFGAGVGGAANYGDADYVFAVSSRPAYVFGRHGAIFKGATEGYDVKQQYARPDVSISPLSVVRTMTAGTSMASLSGLGSEFFRPAFYMWTFGWPTSVEDPNAVKGVRALTSSDESEKLGLLRRARDASRAGG